MPIETRLARDLALAGTRIGGVRKLLVASLMVGAAILAVSGMARGESVAGPSRGMLVHTPAGAGVSRIKVAEPSGVIRLFRVVAPAGTRVKVTGVIPGLAGVSISVPRVRRENAETCARHGRAVVCIEAEEACPMPAATWQFRVRRLAGPAGRIRIDFVVGAASAGRYR